MFVQSLYFTLKLDGNVSQQEIYLRAYLRKTYRDYGKKPPVFQKIAEWEFRSPNLGQK